jgi:hypothetical protein
VSNNAFNDWLRQGEQLYDNALKDFHMLESQLVEMEARLAAKQAEVNEIARVIGKPQVEGSRRLSAQLVSAEVIEVPERVQSANSNATIARALTGKFGR